MNQVHHLLVAVHHFGGVVVLTEFLETIIILLASSLHQALEVLAHIGKETVFLDFVEGIQLFGTYLQVGEFGGLGKDSQQVLILDVQLHVDVAAALRTRVLLIKVEVGAESLHGVAVDIVVGSNPPQLCTLHY